MTEQTQLSSAIQCPSNGDTQCRGSPDTGGGSVPTPAAAPSIDMPYHSHAHKVDLNPGEVVPVRVEVLPFAHVFRQGSQLRLTIQSPKAVADLWIFAPQPPAVNQIVHDAAHPSALVLGLLPGQSDAIPRQPAPCGSLHAQPCRPAVG